MATQLIADQHNPVRFRALALFQMAVSIKFNSHEPRENRLGSITGYCGSLQDLFKKACCGNLHNKERCFSQPTLPSDEIYIIKNDVSVSLSQYLQCFLCF